jgi:hypothetical protein
VKLPFKAIEHPEDEAYQLLRITVCRRLWSQICAELKEREYRSALEKLDWIYHEDYKIHYGWPVPLELIMIRSFDLWVSRGKKNDYSEHIKHNERGGKLYTSKNVITLV